MNKDIDFKNLREAFRSLDKKNTGILTITEIKEAFKESGLNQENLEELFKSFSHHDRNGQINYSEFLAATVDKSKALSHHNLCFAFHHFDVNNSGFITE